MVKTTVDKTSLRRLVVTFCWPEFSGWTALFSLNFGEKKIGDIVGSSHGTCRSGTVQPAAISKLELNCRKEEKRAHLIEKTSLTL